MKIDFNSNWPIESQLTPAGELYTGSIKIEVLQEIADSVKAGYALGIFSLKDFQNLQKKMQHKVRSRKVANNARHD